MDENKNARKKNRDSEDHKDRMLDNLAEITASKVKTYVEIQQQKEQLYSTDHIKGNVLMIDELMDHAENLQLTGAQKEDLSIRRNRIKDFELLNDRAKEDSDKMTQVKEAIRQYELLLSMAPNSREEYQAFCMLAEKKCDDVIRNCNEYLDSGKSLKFWKGERNDRFQKVGEAKERFLKEKDVFSALSELTDIEKFLRNGDTLLDLLNLEAINERLAAYGKKETEALTVAETPEISDVKEMITQIRKEMAKPMPGVTVTQDQTADRMMELFAGLFQRIDDCLKKGRGEGYAKNEALKDILAKLRNRTKEDRAAFLDQLVSYRSWLCENEEESAKEHTWCDAWNYVRSVEYDLDAESNGLEVKGSGAGASALTAIRNTRKRETVYFRQEENAGGSDADVLVEHFMRSIDKDLNCEENVKEVLRFLFRSILTQKVIDDSAAMDRLQWELHTFRKQGGYEQNMATFIRTDMCTPEVKSLINKAGTTKETKEAMGKALSLFAQKVFQWSESTNTAKIEPDQSLSNRNVATSRVASLLGISSMVSETRTAVVKMDGKKIKGTAVENSRGKDIRTIDKEWSYSDQAIAQSFTLQVFDMLCGQIDRHWGNFLVTTKKQDGQTVVKSIKAINNEMAFGRLNWTQIRNGYKRISPLTAYHVRTIPIDVINRILSLKPEFLEEMLGDLLDHTYMESMQDRLKGIQKAIMQYAEGPDAGLIIKENGEAEFTGDDADDTLRMLKAVKQLREDLHTDEDHIKRIDGKKVVIEYNAHTWKSLLLFRHFQEGELDRRIEERKKDLHRNK